MSDKTAEMLFADALAAFQENLPSIGKGSRAEVPTKNGGKYSYTYAALPDILEATLPALTKQGLSFTATPDVTEHGFVLRYALIHVGGHRESGCYPLPSPASSSPQQIGSAITYGRRYCFTAVTGIAPDEDDDGQTAADARSEPLPRAPRRRGATTRHGGPDDPTTHVDEWTVQTDVTWLEDARKRLDLAQSVGEVRGLWAEAAGVQKEGRLDHEDAAAFKAEMERRTAELQPQEGDAA